LTVGSVRTAVIPAAGVGTRFLPVTKAVPKELLTVVDRPSRQWVVEEALAAGIDETVIVTSSPKKPLEDQFSQMIELESVLEERENLELLDRVRRITDLATFHFALQPSPPGLGHAILVAAPHGGDEPFAVLLPDELLPDGGQTVQRMIDVAESAGESVVSLIETEGIEITEYGCAGYSARDGDIDVVGFDTGPKVDWCEPTSTVASRRQQFCDCCDAQSGSGVERLLVCRGAHARRSPPTRSRSRLSTGAGRCCAQ